MEIQHIIVQAGGKGTRMEHLTRNKPKALVSIDNLPMIFHLFRRFPEARFHIIGDYKYHVLDRYLEAFADDVSYDLVDARGTAGTCGGLGEALKRIPEDEPFLLIWSDLILPGTFEVPEKEADYIGISKGFRCRWKYEGGKLEEEPSLEYGVAGLFIFRNKKDLWDVPEKGEFVRWLQGKGLDFDELPLHKTKEVGLLSVYEELPVEKCRPFNRIYIDGDYIIKEGIDEQGQALAIRERAWYEKVRESRPELIPQIVSLEPLKMERIQGQNIYEYDSLSKDAKTEILEKIIHSLREIHGIGEAPGDWVSCEEAYIGKTLKRLEKVRKLIPFADQPTININGRVCRNIFFHQEKLAGAIRSYYPEKFVFLHGDCTFSNMMLRETDASPVLIDPRGYFGHTEFYGDPAYDWGKLYYSVVGDYDRFNLGEFQLEILEDEVRLQIESNCWKDMEDDFFQLLEGEADARQIRLIHGIIWLSLTTYAWDNYDAVCGAFYNGIYYLEEAL